MRSTKAARRYHSTHARLAEEVRARSTTPDAPADAGDFIGAAVIVLGGAALVAFASLAAPAHGTPIAGLETAQDGGSLLGWAMFGFGLAFFLTAILWPNGERVADEVDYRNAESRGGDHGR